MPAFTLTVRHRLSREEATTRLKTLLHEVKNRYAHDISQLREEWGPYAVRFSFNARGHDISGVLTVGWFQVTLEGELPHAVMPWQSPIERLLREQAQALLR